MYVASNTFLGEGARGAGLSRGWGRSIGRPLLPRSTQKAACTPPLRMVAESMPATGTLNCVDNKKGYVPGNVLFCRLDTNSKKNNRPVNEFMKQLDLEFPEACSVST